MELALDSVDTVNTVTINSLGSDVNVTIPVSCSAIIEDNKDYDPENSPEPNDVPESDNVLEHQKNDRIKRARKKFVKKGGQDEYAQKEPDNIKTKKKFIKKSEKKKSAQGETTQLNEENSYPKSILKKSFIEDSTPIPFSQEELEEKILSARKNIFYMKGEMNRVLSEHDITRKNIESVWFNRINNAEEELKSLIRYSESKPHSFVPVQQVSNKNNYAELVKLLSKYPVYIGLKADEKYKGYTIIFSLKRDLSFVKKLESSLEVQSMYPNKWAIEGHVFFNKAERSILYNNGLGFKCKMFFLATEENKKDKEIIEYGKKIHLVPKYENLDQLCNILINKYPQGVKPQVGEYLKEYTVIYPLEDVPKNLKNKFFSRLPTDNISKDAWVLQGHIDFTDNEKGLINFLSMVYTHIREPEPIIY